MKRLLAGAVLSAVAGSGAGAQVAPPRFNPAAPENRQVMPSFSYATVEPVLKQIGAQFRRAGDPARPTLMVTFSNNRRATITMSGCDSAGANCKALSVQSYWTRIANATPDQTGAAISAFNHKYAFAKAFVASDGRPALQRYLTADFGFVRGNLAVNLLVFANQADRYATEVLGPLEARRPAAPTPSPSPGGTP